MCVCVCVCARLCVGENHVPGHGGCQRGLTEEMPENVPFLHSESCHSLPTQPTDTILAYNES